MLIDAQDKRYIAKITAYTFASILALSLIPGYLRLAINKPDSLSWEFRYIVVFTLFNLVTIGLPYLFHRKYTPDYSKLKNIWFFIIIGDILGVIFGEQGNPVMLIPYGIMMFIYSRLYRKHIWWKVALSGYLAGILLESGLNRAPIQVPTLMWFGLLTYPYFLAKIFENRHQIPWARILKKLLILSVIAYAAGYLGYLLTRNNPSPPVIVLFALVALSIYHFKSRRK